MTVTHDLNVLPAGSERMDAYLTRRWPGRVTSWYDECDAGNIEIRDYFSVQAGMYTKEHWYIQWWTGQEWVKLGDLEAGTRPRMHDGYCYIVSERDGPSSP